MLQLRVLILEVGQFRPDLLEGGFWKLKIGQVDVSPRLCVAGTCIIVWLWGGCPSGFRNRDEWGWLGNDKVSRRFFHSGLYCFHIRTKLIHDFILRDCQSVHPRFVDVIVVLVEMEDVRREEGGFSANVWDRFFYVFLDQFAPIYKSDSGNGSEQGIRHGDVEALRLLRTEDRQDELNDSTLSRIPAIPRVESVLKVVIPSKLPDMQAILAASPSLALPWREPVNLRPYLGCPLLWILPHCPKPLIPPLKQNFFQCRLTP